MGKNSLGKKLTASPYLVWAALFIIVPLIFVVYYSVTGPDGKFTLEYISDIGKYKDVMLNSICWALLQLSSALLWRTLWLTLWQEAMQMCKEQL